MHNRNIAIVTMMLYFLVACSSNGSSTPPDVELDESTAEQMPNETDMSGDTQATEGDEQDSPDNLDSTPVPTPTNPLEGIGSVQLLGSGFGFLEGPVYRPSDNSVYFSDIPANTILRLDADGSIEPFRENQPTNGLLFDSQNRLLIATHGGRALSRLEESGSVTVLAERFDGALFNSPNDIALHANGGLYFTDPPYGIDPESSEIGCAGVYRLTVDGSLSRFWCNGIESRPNGIALSPNQDRLYVSFTLGGEILSSSIAADGSVGEMETFAITAGFPDGMAVDAEGNVFVTSVAGVEVFAPDGTLWGTIEFPEQPANCALGRPTASGGSTLFVTARTGLYSVELQ